MFFGRYQFKLRGRKLHVPASWVLEGKALRLEHEDRHLIARVSEPIRANAKITRGHLILPKEFLVLLQGEEVMLCGMLDFFEIHPIRDFLHDQQERLYLP